GNAATASGTHAISAPANPTAITRGGTAPRKPCSVQLQQPTAPCEFAHRLFVRPESERRQRGAHRGGIRKNRVSISAKAANARELDAAARTWSRRPVPRRKCRGVLLPITTAPL